MLYSIFSNLCDLFLSCHNEPKYTLKVKVIKYFLQIFVIWNIWSWKKWGARYTFWYIVLLTLYNGDRRIVHWIDLHIWGQQSSCDGFNLCGEKRKRVNLILTPKHSEAMAFVVFPSHNLSYERPIIRVSGGSKSLKQNDIIGCFITGSKAFHLFVWSNAREFFCCDPYSSWSHL